MKIVQQITSDPLQKQTLILDDGTRIECTFYFRPLQQGWWLESISYGDFSLSGLRIVTSPNFLQQYKNKIPFGLACYTTDNGEPKLQQDFSSGYATIYVLSSDEVIELQNFYDGQV